MILMAFIATSCFVSCSDSPDELSASKAEKLVKKEMKRLNQLVQGYTVTTGYYECNDADIRYKYRQLAANDLITYKCDKVEKPETCWSYFPRILRGSTNTEELLL